MKYLSGFKRISPRVYYKILLSGGSATPPESQRIRVIEFTGGRGRGRQEQLEEKLKDEEKTNEKNRKKPLASGDPPANYLTQLNS